MKRIALFYLHTLAALASLVSLAGMLLIGEWQATIALLSIILFLVALLLLAYAWMRGYLHAKYPDGYSRISTFVRYSTDGATVRYETYKNIQCRQPVMSSIRYGFKWTGSRAPVVTSALQEVRTRTDGGPNDYDRVELVFPQPLLYGECAVVHHGMEMNDSDAASSPHVEFRVTEPVQLIVWRIELRHVHRGHRRDARVTRRPIDARFSTRPEPILAVPFDPVGRGYEYHIRRPEPGYFYRLEWDR
jgi:hypothetical protein